MHSLEHSNRAIEAPDGNTGTTRRERVAFAMEPGSGREFLAHYDPALFPNARHEAFDLPSLDANAWERFLREWEPTVIVTGWGSPRLPDHYAASPDTALGYVCHLAGSVRQIVPRALIERGVLVSNWGTTSSTAVAEHAMLLTLGSLRDLSAWGAYLDTWPKLGRAAPHLPMETRSLRGKRVGLHGFGSIARELVGMLRAFGAEIAAYSHGVPAALFERHRVVRRDSLRELFSNSDVLIECEALTPQTRGTVDEATLRCLPEGAVFVNVGRGPVVDEEALIRVARERRLRLGLDVFHKEPLAAESGLRALPSTLLSRTSPVRRRTGSASCASSPSPTCNDTSSVNPLRHASRSKFTTVRPDPEMCRQLFCQDDLHGGAAGLQLDARLDRCPARAA